MTFQAVAKQSSNSTPARVDHATSRLVEALRSRLEKGPHGGYSISDRQAPSDAERRIIERRRAELLAALGGAGERALVPMLAQLFLGFHGGRNGQDETAAQLALFANQLADLPIWAVQAGCGEILRRNVAWPPSIGQLRAACVAACEKQKAELADIAAILNADVWHDPNEIEREKVNEGFQKLIEDLKLNAPLDQMKPKEKRLPTKQEAAEWLEQEAVKPAPCIMLSETARRSLGLPDSQGAAA